MFPTLKPLCSAPWCGKPLPKGCRRWCSVKCGEKAARLFERAVEVRPEDYQAALLLPQVYRALGRTEESKRAALLGLEIAERHLPFEFEHVIER